MPILSNLTTVVLLLIAHCGSWTGANRLGPFKVCPSCRDPLGAGRPPRDHNAAGSTSVLASGEPCGVYTLSCAKGLRCVPPPREHSPLQALLQGRGICAKHSRTSPTERPHPTGPHPSHSGDIEKAPCRKLLNSVLRGLELTIFQSDRDIYIPNCDTRGFYRKKQGKELPTFKDMDFRNNMQKVYVTEEQKEKFMEKLNRDVEFLVRLKIMDYSLLLGIHDVGRAEREDEEVEEVSNEEEPEAENGLAGATVGSYGTSPEGIAGYMSSCKPLGPGEFDPYVDVYAVGSCPGAPQREVYFMGLIDVLTQYDTKKKAAHAAKTVKHGAGAEISTVHPEQYAKRFRDFISNIFA